MRFAPHLLDEIRSRLSVSQVVGRKVALKKKGREFAGLSPFKAEKTPSFFVNDQKGFYHCFASGEHGDIFAFVMKTEGLEFPEAVERLASEAGVAMPKATEYDAAREDERDRLYRLLTASARYFEQCLRSGAGGEARSYLERRGIDAAAIATFGIGFASHSKSALKEHLAGQGFTVSDMVTSGMLISGEDVREPYDRFRNRVMFPIHDLKGRVIAFGGRALDSDAPAKYLNSPESPLFHKGHVLFNAHRARAAAHDKGRIIAVEGYMDVIALAQAGIAEAVAPLGTALTEEQSGLLWRLSSEPLLCFDGDSAGRKAAFRAVDTVLPKLQPGRSVSFAFLPNGLDPDDVIRQQGAAALEVLLSQSRPLIDVVWERELQAAPYGTPEQRAALEARLTELSRRIADTPVRTQYQREIRDRLFQLSRSTRSSGHRTNRAVSTGVASSDWKARERQRLTPHARRLYKADPPSGASSELSGRPATVSPREALILKTILNHTWLIDDYAEDIAGLMFQSDALAALRDGILAIHATANFLDSEILRTQLSKSGVSKVVDLAGRAITHLSDGFAESGACRNDVEAGWRHICALHQRQHGLEHELQAAQDAWYRDCTEAAEGRLLEIQRQIATLGAEEHFDNATAADPGPGVDEAKSLMIRVAPVIAR